MKSEPIKRNEAKIIKLKVGDIQPNPFKKQINKGKLDREQINRLKSNLKELGFMGSLDVVKIKDKYHLVFGHHRLQATKEVFGKDYIISVNVKEHNDDNLLRGMVIENLTQRANEFKEEVENIAAIKNHLEKQKTFLSESDKKVKPNDYKFGRPKGTIDETSGRAISEWLNKNGQVVMEQPRISELLTVHKNLSPELIDEVEKLHRGDADRRGVVLGKSQAVLLSKFEDHKEQKDLRKAMMNSIQQNVRVQSSLLSGYKQLKESDDETDKLLAKKIREGKVDLVAAEKKDAPIIISPTNGKKSLTEELVELKSAASNFACKVDSFRERGLTKRLNEDQAVELMSSLQNTIEEPIKGLWDDIKEGLKNNKDGVINIEFDKKKISKLK